MFWRPDYLISIFAIQEIFCNKIEIKDSVLKVFTYILSYAKVTSLKGN